MQIFRDEAQKETDSAMKRIMDTETYLDKIRGKISGLTPQHTEEILL